MGLSVKDFYNHEPQQFRNRWEGNQAKRRANADVHRTVMFHHAITVVNASRAKRFSFDILKDFPFSWDEDTKEAIKETRIDEAKIIQKEWRERQKSS